MTVKAITTLVAVALSARASLGFAQEAAPQTVPSSTSGSEEIPTENFSIHGQFTNVTQYHPPFTSPFYGPNSLIPGHRGDETTDLTLYPDAPV